MTATILHVDLDAFFASVEQLDDPSLRGKPVLVGGASRRGVVAAASYEARAYGVHSAMSMVEALRRCPKAIVVTPTRGRYEELSSQVFAIFHRFTPEVEGLSIDEAFLDVTGSRSLFGDGETIARAIKDAVKRETGLTASAGVAATKFMAKIASDMRKPDGLVVVAPGDEKRTLDPLPLERMWGVGPKSAATLRSAGFDTIGDLARARPQTLERLLGSWGEQVHALANGVDFRTVEPHDVARSISAEETFERDLRTVRELEPKLLSQAQRVAERMVEQRVFGRAITLKIKYADFKLCTRRETLPDAIADTTTLYEAARRLLERVPGISRGVRLTGIAVSDLSQDGPPPSLFPDEHAIRRHAIEQAAVALRQRFGEAAATRATLLTIDEREAALAKANRDTTRSRR